MHRDLKRALYMRHRDLKRALYMRHRDLKRVSTYTNTETWIEPYIYSKEI